MTEISFLLGNGFDLCCGLKSRFIDMYPRYIEQPSNNPVIEKFKDDIRNDETKHYETWADFEMGMAEYANTFSNEDEMVLCVRSFRSFLNNYLKEEQEKVIHRMIPSIKNCRIEFEQSLRNRFFLGLTPNDELAIKEAMRGSINYKVVSFNYTSKVLEALSSDALPRQDIIHIHGKIGSDIILGINDEKQFRELPYILGNKGKRAFIKPIINEKTDSSRIKKAEDSIKQSDIICIFGMSLGASDQYWKDLLKKQLLEREDCHLIFYRHGIPDIPQYLMDERIEREEQEKDWLLNCLGISIKDIDPVRDRVHIPISNKIFDIDNILTRAEQEAKARADQVRYNSNGKENAVSNEEVRINPSELLAMI